jgi:radical SAM superfamily enzyme YgiQ (UPF0313 family)
MILRIIESLKKVQPQVKIWFGGPEVSYNVREYLLKYKELDGIVIGEGEKTFYELVEYYQRDGKELDNINGIAFKDSARKDQEAHKKDGEVIQTPPRRLMPLNDIPFAYPDIDTHRNKIIYYESSRGCPYSCSYCLSSAQRGVRYRSLDLVKSELKIFLEHKIPQIKFVDRTFNCNKERAMEIWKFIKEHDNGITNFHFEITADLLSNEELEILDSLRPGLIQFEIGVQTTNPDTMKVIRRKVDFNRLSANVKHIRNSHNIHQHLDLIAGLPLEDYSSFEKSFKDVYQLKPDQLQLGFLKVLKGSAIESECKDYGIVYNSEPPYEVLYTKHLTYDEIIELKGISDMVEIYYNSGQFVYSMEYLEHFFDTPMKLYASLYHYYNENGLYELSHSRIKRYEILLEFYKDIMNDKTKDDEYNNEMLINDAKERLAVFKEILVFDICLREALKNRPDYSGTPIPYHKFKQISENHKIKGSRIHLEKFDFDVMKSARQGKAIKGECIILFDYDNRDPITKSANIKVIKEE